MLSKISCMGYKKAHLGNEIAYKEYKISNKIK